MYIYEIGPKRPPFLLEEGIVTIETAKEQLSYYADRRSELITLVLLDRIDTQAAFDSPIMAIKGRLGV